MGNAISTCTCIAGSERPLVVALHGTAGNRPILLSQLESMMPWLHANVDLHIFEGHQRTPEDHPQVRLMRFYFGHDQKLLQYANMKQVDGLSYFDPDSLDAALDDLEQQLELLGRPVDCLIGFSMGAVVAALLCDRDRGRRLIRRAILLCPVGPERWGRRPVGAAPISTPALVVSGAADDVVGDTAAAVAHEFTLARTLVHTEGHIPLPRNGNDLDALAAAMRQHILASSDQSLGPGFLPRGGIEQRPPPVVVKPLARLLAQAPPAQAPPVQAPPAQTAAARAAAEALAIMNGIDIYSLGEARHPPSVPPSPPAPRAAGETADAWAHRFFELQAARAWQTLDGVHRVWATSDLHVEGRPNMELLRGLTGYDADALIVAGDVCTPIELLREALALLASKFRHCFYVVGNHELWMDGVATNPTGSGVGSGSNAGSGVGSSSGGVGGGVGALPDSSLAKLLAILEVATDVGVHVHPALVGSSLAIIPLQSWYHYGFLGVANGFLGGGTPGGELCDPPPDFQLLRMDGGCNWAPLGEGVRSTSRLLSPFFARLNEPVIERAREEQVAGRRLISLSHFLPRAELHRGFSYLGDVEGSWPLGEQVGRLRPDVHVFGHTHWTVDEVVDGVRYVQYPLGYAHERPRERYRISASERAPFALVWEAAAGAMI